MDGAQTLTNGLGFGGQIDYFALFIKSDFTSGHSRASPISTTFASPQLSRQPEFKIEMLEAISIQKDVEKSDHDLLIRQRMKRFYSLKNPPTNVGNTKTEVPPMPATLHRQKSARFGKS